MNNYEVLERNKLPIGQYKYLGIEIEFFCPYYYDDLSRLLVKHKLEYNCHLGEDSSIQPEDSPISAEDQKKIDKLEELQELEYKINGYYTNKWYNYSFQVQKIEKKYVSPLSDENCFELRILTTEEEMESVLERVGLVLKEVKAQVNQSCGLHVHLDMRHRDSNKCYERLYAKQQEMFSMVEKSRKTSTYCKPSTKAMNNNSDTRYRAINTDSLRKFSTIEIRLHEGCVDVKLISNWCKYLINIINKKKHSKEIQNYVKQRIKSNAS